MLLSDILWFNSNTLIVECQHKNKKEDGKIHPLYIQNQLSNLPPSLKV